MSNTALVKDNKNFKINRGLLYEILPPSKEYGTGTKRLICSIIAFALIDATHRSNSKYSKKRKDAAKDWLFNSDEFEDLCSLIGLNAQLIRGRLLEIL